MAGAGGNDSGTGYDLNEMEEPITRVIDTWRVEKPSLDLKQGARSTSGIASVLLVKARGNECGWHSRETKSVNSLVESNLLNDVHSIVYVHSTKSSEGRDSNMTRAESKRHENF